MDLRLAKDLPMADIPGCPTKTTCYKWHSLGKHPKVLFKFAGKLLFDAAEWMRMAEAARDKHSLSINS